MAKVSSSILEGVGSKEVEDYLAQRKKIREAHSKKAQQEADEKRSDYNAKQEAEDKEKEAIDAEKPGVQASERPLANVEYDSKPDDDKKVVSYNVKPVDDISELDTPDEEAQQAKEKAIGQTVPDLARPNQIKKKKQTPEEEKAELKEKGSELLKSDIAKAALKKNEAKAKLNEEFVAANNEYTQNMADLLKDVYTDGKWHEESGENKTNPEIIAMLNTVNAKPRLSNNKEDKDADPIKMLGLNTNIAHLLSLCAKGDTANLKAFLVKQGKGDALGTLNRAQTIYNNLKGKTNRTPVEDAVLNIIENGGRAGVRANVRANSENAADFKQAQKDLATALNKKTPKTREDYDVYDMSSLADRWVDDPNSPEGGYYVPYITEIPKGSKFVHVPAKGGAGHNMVLLEAYDDLGRKNTYGYVPTRKNAMLGVDMTNGIKSEADKKLANWDIDRAHPYMYISEKGIDEALPMFVNQAIGNTGVTDSKMLEIANRPVKKNNRGTAEHETKRWEKALGKSLEELLAIPNGPKDQEEILDALTSIKDPLGRQRFVINKDTGKLDFAYRVPADSIMKSKKQEADEVAALGRLSRFTNKDGSLKKGVTEDEEGNLVYTLPSSKDRIVSRKDGSTVHYTNYGTDKQKAKVTQAGSYSNIYANEANQTRLRVLEAISSAAAAGNLTQDDIQNTAAALVKLKGGDFTAAKYKSALNDVYKAAGILTQEMLDKRDAKLRAEIQKAATQVNPAIISAMKGIFD